MLNTFFHRRESNKVDVQSLPAIPYDFDLPADLGVMELLAAAYSLGLPRGSARGGCFEIQNDLGIWSSSTGKRITAKNATFAAWAELEAAE